MSSIPLTFNEHQVSTTIIGGLVTNKSSQLDISVVLLNSGKSYLRNQLFDSLLSCNFASIISVEKNAVNYGLEELTRKYPQIKFILPMGEATDGELINIAMGEVESTYVLVLRDNLYIPTGIILTHLAERLTKNDIFCVVPRLVNKNKTSLPCLYTPSASKTKFLIESSTVAGDGIKTLYAFDYIALYNRQKFIGLGGFDCSIKSPYWQLVDLFLRSWLWGEETRMTTLLQFSYTEDAPAQNKTYNMDYLHFYLKNQLPKMRNGEGVIKRSSFIIFLIRSSCGLMEARRLFKAARKWVEINKYRFRIDLESLIVNWGEKHENK